MKALVVYESMFGNTEAIARAVADRLSEAFEVTLSDVRAMPPAHDVDLLVVGAPTHALSLSRPSTREEAIRQGAEQGLASRGMREWLDGLPIDLHRLPYAAFDTRVSRVRRLPGSAARSASRILRRHEGVPVVAAESFFVDDVRGPLGEEELERARAWGARLRSIVLRDHAPAT